MKHGTNIYITNTVHKKNQTNKQTHPHHVYTKTVILLTPNEIQDNTLLCTRQTFLWQSRHKYDKQNKYQQQIRYTFLRYRLKKINMTNHKTE